MGRGQGKDVGFQMPDLDDLIDEMTNRYEEGWVSDPDPVALKELLSNLD